MADIKNVELLRQDHFLREKGFKFGEQGELLRADDNPVEIRVRQLPPQIGDMFGGIGFPFP